MAKRSKSDAARPRGRLRRDESAWMRSIESLGRMIGSLQRELDGAADAALKRRARPARAAKRATRRS